MNDHEVRRIIVDLLTVMGVDIEEVVVVGAEGQPVFEVRTKDSALLIGNQGERLKALNHLVKRIVERTLGRAEASRFLLDVNGYQRKHLGEIRNRARMLAERARLFKYDVEMSPMNAYERMVVHAVFADDPDIKTESLGEGKFRRIVIRYRERDNPTSL